MQHSDVLNGCVCLRGNGLFGIACSLGGAIYGYIASTRQKQMPITNCVDLPHCGQLSYNGAMDTPKKKHKKTSLVLTVALCSKLAIINLKSTSSRNLRFNPVVAASPRKAPLQNLRSK